MKYFIGTHEVLNDDELIELALGTPLDLWLGVEDESPLECAARLDAARDILADDPGLVDRVTRAAVVAIEAHAPDLFTVIPLPTARRTHRATARKAVAA